MLFGSRSTGIPGLAPPQVLIFLHIPKTGGQTMGAILAHCFPDQHFNPELEHGDTALLLRSTPRIAEKFRQLPVEKQRAVRCMIPACCAMDVDTIFDRPSKFFTIVRHPVDRVISNFFHIRRFSHLPFYRFIKDLTLEQYLDSGIGLYHDNQQVRMLSGCPELDAPWDLESRPISSTSSPVERRHLEMAKRNIEERFIAAAPLEEFAALVWFLKRLYGWPFHWVVFRIHNQNPNRPKLAAVSEATRKRLETLNQYDIEVYEWVKARFAKQIQTMEPHFSREARRFDMLTRAVHRIDRLSPQPIRGLAHRLMFPSG
ncbi:MAG TPA: sulfotransferase family 2 domain-containing protein [Methylocella sp.]|nr:sulfotransferase family 2 domain-containing protein [Methylocella sp.]